MAQLITRNLDKVGKQIARELKQTRFAAAVALTRTAYQTSQELKDEAEKDLDDPTPFTKRGFRYRKANKKTLEAAVYIAPIQSDYLRWAIVGGRRRARARSGEAIPVNIRLNRFGNIPARHRGKLLKLMNRPDTFIGTIKGVYGLYQRPRGRTARRHTVKLLYSLEAAVDYSPKFDFYETTSREFDRRYEKEFNKAYREALRSAR